MESIAEDGGNGEGYGLNIQKVTITKSGESSKSKEHEQILSQATISADNSDGHQQSSSENHTPDRALKKMKKGIYISYSPDAGYEERAFVIDLVRQLKDNNMSDDIWFDKDENCIDKPVWFSQRMEAVERCQTAILVLSDHYFTCPVSVYEGRTLLERQPIKLFAIKLTEFVDTEMPPYLTQLLPDLVDLTEPGSCKLSIPEKTSVVISHIMEKLEKFAVINSPLSVSNSLDPEFNGEYKSKAVCCWTAANLQEWLYNLGVKEFYREILAEKMIDGFLLLSVTDADMVDQLGIDSRVVRKKIMQSLVALLDKEHKAVDNWHLRARTTRSRPNTVYLIYDPSDVRLAQTFKHDLSKKGLQVIHHQKLGQSKEEFLKLNGPYIATASHVILVLTDHSSNSPFVFHETLFADWLGKKILVALFKNDWKNLRPSMRAVAAECLAIDFERNLYTEGMDILEHHLKPIHSMPGVVLEQSYLSKMSEGLKPLIQLALAHTGPACDATLSSPGTQLVHLLLALDWSIVEVQPVPVQSEEHKLSVFISFQWDMQSKVAEIQKLLEGNGISCWSDSGAQMRGHSSLSTRSSLNLHSSHDARENIKSSIQRSMKNSSLVICCVTPKYIQSDNCVNDLKLAESLNKPIIALVLRFTSWPPEAALPSVRKTLVKCKDIVELYNDKLFKQNLVQLTDRVKKVLANL